MKCYTEICQEYKAKVNSGRRISSCQLIFRLNSLKWYKFKEKCKINNISFSYKNLHNKTTCCFGKDYDGLFLYTNNPIDNGWGIEERSEEFFVFLEKYMQKENPQQQESAVSEAKTIQTPSSTVDVLSMARKGGNSEKFKEMFDEGNMSRYKNDEVKAAIALCNILAFYSR